MNIGELLDILDAIANLPEVDAAEGGGEDAVRNALAKLRDERDRAKAQVAELVELIDASLTEAGENVSMQAWGWLKDLSEKAHALILTPNPK